MKKDAENTLLNTFEGTIRKEFDEQQKAIAKCKEYLDKKGGDKAAYSAAKDELHRFEDRIVAKLLEDREFRLNFRNMHKQRTKKFPSYPRFKWFPPGNENVAKLRTRNMVREEAFFSRWLDKMIIIAATYTSLFEGPYTMAKRSRFSGTGVRRLYLTSQIEGSTGLFDILLIDNMEQAIPILCLPREKNVLSYVTLPEHKGWIPQSGISKVGSESLTALENKRQVRCGQSFAAPVSLCISVDAVEITEHGIRLRQPLSFDPAIER